MPLIHSSDHVGLVQLSDIQNDFNLNSYSRSQRPATLSRTQSTSLAQSAATLSRMDSHENNVRLFTSASKRRTSWLDEVGTTPSTTRRSSQLDGRRPDVIAASHLEHRASPSILRPTAPNFSLLGRGETQSAVIDEDDEVSSNFNSLSLGRNSSIWAEGEVRGHSPLGSSQFYVPHVHSRAPERIPYHDPRQYTERISTESSRSSREESGGNDHLALTRSTTHPANQETPPKPRALTFSADTLAKLNGWQPNYNFADFREKNSVEPLNTPNSCFAVVEFKLFRAEVYQMRLDWAVSEGVSLVTVEADRGYDLGKVYRVTNDIEEARNIKKLLYRKHWDTMLRLTTWAQRISPLEYTQAFEQHFAHIASSAHASGFTGSMPPKSIIGRPTRQQLEHLQSKEGFEEKARRDTQKKAGNLNLDMEILAAEFQFDMQKLTLYYLAPHYIPYQALQNEVYKVYKCRLWFSALNPDSFYPPAQKPDNAHIAQAIRRNHDFAAQSPTGPPYGYQASPYERAQDVAAQRYFSSGRAPEDSTYGTTLITTTPFTVPTPWNPSPNVVQSTLTSPYDPRSTKTRQ